MNRIHFDSRALSPSVLSNRQYSTRLSIRTDATGRISLLIDWVSLFQEIEKIGSYYLQSRHAYARLVAKTAAVKLAWLEEGERAIGDEGKLLLTPSNRHQVFAFVSRCSCCQSPGRIEFRNEFDLEVMQLCCGNEIGALDWGEVVSRCASKLPSLPSKERIAGIPKIPKQAKLISRNRDTLAAFFNTLSAREVRFEATLISSGVVHREKIRPEHIDWSDQMMMVMDEGKTLQLGLSGVRALYAAEEEKGGCQLYVAGTDNVQLLAIKGIDTLEERDAFRAVFAQLLKHTI